MCNKERDTLIGALEASLRKTAEAQQLVRNLKGDEAAVAEQRRVAMEELDEMLRTIRKRKRDAEDAAKDSARTTSGGEGDTWLSSLS